MTIVTSPLRPHLQIILRIYSSPAEVLMGFDLDSCAVGCARVRSYFESCRWFELVVVR